MTADKHALLRRLTALFMILMVCAWGALLFALNGAMHRPPEQFGRFMARMPMAVFLVAPFETMWTRARAGQLNVGDPAPDFSLSTLDKSARVELAGLRDKPVVLVFGSYT